VANPPSRIDIPSGAILEDKVITGDLRKSDPFSKLYINVLGILDH
jgi:hypothetical protein